MKNQITINGIRFLKHGLKDAAGNYFPAHWHRGAMVDGKEAITIYAKDICKGLPAALNPSNNSDSRTDYFEKDRVRFNAGTPEFDLLATIAR